jgi:hypothetical protein
MATRATSDINPQPNTVLVIINPHLDNVLDKPACRSLMPETLTTPAEVMCLPSYDCFLECLLVHYGYHQQLTRRMICCDTWNKAFFIKLRCEFISFLNLFN